MPFPDAGRQRQQEPPVQPGAGNSWKPVILPPWRYVSVVQQDVRAAGRTLRAQRRSSCRPIWWAALCRLVQHISIQVER